MSVRCPDEVRAAFGAVGPILSGRVILVMGASRGIGAGIARGLAHAGATLALASRDLAATDTVADEIGQFAPRPMTIPVDVTDQASVNACVERVVSRHERLDGAVNNAGRSHPAAPFGDQPHSVYDDVLDVNLRGTVLAMQAEIAQMMKVGRGAIVNVASVGSLVGNGGVSLYIAAKHAVAGLTRSAAMDYAEKGIRINAIAPGATFTDLVANGLGKTTEGRDKLSARAPMKRMAHPDEMAGAVIWLLSGLATYVTGAIVPVDGGWTAS